MQERCPCPHNSDLRLVEASIWGGELIPEEEILELQTPEVLEYIGKDRAGLVEREALSAVVDEVEDDDSERTIEEL